MHEQAELKSWAEFDRKVCGPLVRYARKLVKAIDPEDKPEDFDPTEAPGFSDTIIVTTMLANSTAFCAYWGLSPVETQKMLDSVVGRTDGSIAKDFLSTWKSQQVKGRLDGKNDPELDSTWRGWRDLLVRTATHREDYVELDSTYFRQVLDCKEADQLVFVYQDGEHSIDTATIRRVGRQLHSFKRTKAYSVALEGSPQPCLVFRWATGRLRLWLNQPALLNSKGRTSLQARITLDQIQGRVAA